MHKRELCNPYPPACCIPFCKSIDFSLKRSKESYCNNIGKFFFFQNFYELSYIKPTVGNNSKNLYTGMNTFKRRSKKGNDIVP